MANIAVFCGASEGVDSNHVMAAENVGSLIATRAHTLVYGGGTKGLMGGVFRGASKFGGKIIGVIPEGLMDRERGDMLATANAEIKIVGSVDERKRRILEQTEFILVLPGGIGSLEELFAVMCLRDYGYIPHPLGVLNHFGIYDKLFEFLHELSGQKFVSEQALHRIQVADSPQKLLDTMGL